jgi:hypothetical protein
MLSAPLPAAHPFTAVLLLAAVIAARRVQTSGAPASASVLTVMVAARTALPTIRKITPAMRAVAKLRVLLMKTVRWPAIFRMAYSFTDHHTNTPPTEIVV